MLKRIALTIGLIAAMAVTTAFAQTPTDVPPPATLTRVNFVPGTSAYTLTKYLTQGVSEGYLLWVAAGQSIFITKTGDASVQILDPHGSILTAGSTASGPWGVRTTFTGDYTLVLYGEGYITLTVYIPPLGVSPEPPVPLPLVRERIRFSPGSTGYSFSPELVQGYPLAFLLGISAGQQLYVSTQGSVTVALLDPQDNMIMPVAPETGWWQFPISQTGDYSMVLLGQGSAAVALKIPPLGSTPPQPPPAAQRLNFQPGSASATVQGTLAPNSIDRYVLRALAGQTMIIDFAPSQPNLTISISGADGSVLASGGALINTWQGQLPSTQDYYIAVLSNAEVAATYRLQVTIVPLGQTGQPDEPRRISFAPGGTFALVQGTTAKPGLDRFVIRAIGGQTMTVTVSGVQGPVIVIIYGADGNVLISDHAGATTWSGVLPLTQDYFIDTRSVGDAAVDFTLQVTIPPL